MSVIIRLQNLPWSANAVDIRQFFHGLSIPEGGVHIVGGEMGDAFIAFSTDEDARQAFMRNGGKIKETQINLLLSSRTEMQKVIETARAQTMAAFIAPLPAPMAKPPPIMPAIVPSAVPELKKDDARKEFDKRDRRRSRSRSRDRKEKSYERKKDRRRDRTRSKSRERDRGRDRERDRRRRDRSRSRDRSRDRDRKRRDERDRRVDGKSEVRVGVWENPPHILGGVQNTSATLLANFVANNILPNIIQQQQREAFHSRWESPINDIGSTNGFLNDRPNFGGINGGFNRNNGNVSSNCSTPISTIDLTQDKPREIKQDCCIKLYPFFGAFSEIRRFFNGLFIHNDGIKFINDESGKRTGGVYIKFAYPEGKDEAMGRNGDQIRNQVVKIEHIPDEEFDNAVDRFYPDQDGNSKEGSPDKQYHSCIQIEGLPPYAGDADIKIIFPDMKIISVLNEIVGGYKRMYVKFANPADALKAVKNRDAHVFDGMTLKVDFYTDELFDKLKATKTAKPDTTNVIKLSSLPMKCSDRDIVDFFSDIGVVPTKVNLLTDESGFIGEAVCTFATCDDALVAYQKSGMPFGANTVNMAYLPASPSKKKAVATTPQPPMPPPILPKQPPASMMGHMPIMPPRPPYYPPRNFIPPAMLRGPMPPRMPPMMPRMPMRHRFPLIPSPHQQSPSQQSMPGDEQDEELAPQGCVLLMENVPYKAGLDEILDFLDGFDVVSENVLRKYNPNGLPSGETKVIFNSPNEVYQVIQEKRGNRIRERMVYLTQI